MRRSQRADGRDRDRHVLIIVQNLPVPFDRRVWLECRALRANGYQVSVICPKGPEDSSRETIDGVRIYRYRPPREARGALGFAAEFAYCWLRTAILSVEVARALPFRVIQACNPPDTYWLLALLWRPAGVRFVFDHHDLNPELFISRFGHPRTAVQKLEYRILSQLERLTHRTADRVISTNESYRRIAIARGRVRPSHVTVVRSGPDTRVMAPSYPSRPRPSGAVELVYLGIMGPQDNVEIVLHVMDELVHRRGHTGVHATLMGFGDSLESLRRLAHRLDLDDSVTFTGRADRRMVAENLSRADIGLCPDLKTPLNDLSTMNKTMEYMAFALPSVSFDLTESMVSGGDSILVVPSGDVSAFTDAVERLIVDPDLRLRMARAARSRVARDLDWRPQAEVYVGVYDYLLGVERPNGALHADLPPRSRDEWGNRIVPLEDEHEFDRFILERR
ncbi:Glycogen synthase [Acidipropionibacterium jensenii]|uniref:Glycogen synthase n=1 Tax=Acidipropionibacterium jensenii TaxID=1749 RepID=A0A448NVS9_9ACTN|nr:Glycogen synthase [Acidipropionibacterium jensenii]